VIYSCFDPPSGLYHYFETPEQRAINSDLPVPRLPAAVGRIGVPAIDAGRPIPEGARPVGQGWHAQGIVAQCRGGGLSGWGDDSWTWVKNGGWAWLGLASVGLWIIGRRIL